MRHPLREWAAGTTELLDDPRADARTVVASLHDIARINRVFGGSAAAVRSVDQFLGEVRGERASLLDVGTGLGDIPRAVARHATRRGIALDLFGLDSHPAAARAALDAGQVRAIVGDGGRLPLASRSVDFALCAKVLHHLPGAAGDALLRELDRVARIAVIVVDLRRSAIAVAGFWLASFPMRLEAVTRHDGMVSVMRGFTDDELRLRCAGVGVRAAVRRHPGWTLSAAWQPEEGPLSAHLSPGLA